MVSNTSMVIYGVSFISIFLSVIWILVFLENRHTIQKNPKPKKFPFVSIIVPAWNEEKTIAKTIESLHNLHYPKGKTEIIVVDDGSTDRTAEITAAYPVKLIKKRNGGKHSALNKGLKYARGELIACMDADSFVEPDALMKMIGRFEDPNIAAVTSSMKIKNYHENMLAKIQHVEYILSIFLRKMLCYLDALPVTPGPFSVYKKSVVQEVGGFDGSHFVEDMDIAFKIHQAGYKIDNSVNAGVSTLCPTTIRGLYQQRIRWYRGLLGTTYKYKHMMFNKKFGNFGVFFIPANICSVFSVAILLLFMIYNGVQAVYNSLWTWYLTDFSIGYILSSFGSIDISILMIDFQSLFMSTILILALITLSISFRQANEKMRKGTELIAYLFIYPFMMMSFWVLAIGFELQGIEKKWAHKSD